MATPVSWLIGTVLMFLEFGVLACSALGSTRRSQFYLRLSGASFVMVTLALGLAFAVRFSALPQPVAGGSWIALLLAAAAVAPVFCYQTLGSSQDSAGGDGGGGGGSDVPPPHGPPPSGIPLPDADQAPTRRRDHNRPSLGGVSRPRRLHRPRPDRPEAPHRRS